MCCYLVKKEPDIFAIKNTLKILNPLKSIIENIIENLNWPMEIRTFIFEKQVKNSFLYG